MVSMIYTHRGENLKVLNFAIQVSNVLPIRTSPDMHTLKIMNVHTFQNATGEVTHNCHTLD